MIAVNRESSPPIFRMQTDRKFFSLLMLYKAFRNTETGKYEPRSWSQLESKIPKATLSRLLRECIREGGIEPYVITDKVSGKRQGFYRVVKPLQPSVSFSNVKRFWLTLEGKKKNLGIFVGNVIRGSRGRKSYFRLPKDEKARLREKIEETLREWGMEHSKQRVENLLKNYSRIPLKK